jgi:hypothetical protein
MRSVYQLVVRSNVFSWAEHPEGFVVGSGTTLSWSESDVLAPDVASRDCNIPLLSARLVERHREALEASGTLMPLVIGTSAYFHFMPGFAGERCWDEKHSGTLRTHAFHRKRIPDAPAFRLPQFPSEIFWTDTFVNSLMRERFAGFEAIIVWAPHLGY